MNAFDQMRDAINAAREVKRAAEMNANELAKLLEGNLHHLPASRLASLKRELRLFNIHTGRWRAGK